MQSVKSLNVKNVFLHTFLFFTLGQWSSYSLVEYSLLVIWLLSLSRIHLEKNEFGEIVANEHSSLAKCPYDNPFALFWSNTCLFHI